MGYFSNLDKRKAEIAGTEEYKKKKEEALKKSSSAQESKTTSSGTKGYFTRLDEQRTSKPVESSASRQLDYSQGYQRRTSNKTANDAVDALKDMYTQGYQRRNSNQGEIDLSAVPKKEGISDNQSIYSSTAEDLVSSRIEKNNKPSFFEQFKNAVRTQGSKGTLGDFLSSYFTSTGTTDKERQEEVNAQAQKEATGSYPSGYKTVKQRYGLDGISEERLKSYENAARKRSDNPLTSAENNEAATLTYLDHGDTTQYQKYTMMTDEEKQTYNQIYGLYGKAAAEDYHNRLLDQINSRIAEKNYKENSSANPVSNTIYQFSHGIESGLQGVADAGDWLLGIDRTRANSVSDYTAGQIRNDKNNSAAENIAYDIASSTGNMVPGIVASAVTGGAAAGSVVFALSQAGNSYRQDLNEGKDASISRLHGAQQFVDEEATNALLGGIGAFGGGAIKKVLSNTGAAQAMVKGIDRIAKTEKGKQLLNLFLDKLADMGSEGAQEYVQFFTENITNNLLFGEDNSLNPMDPEAWYAAALGALNAGVLNAPGTALEASDIINNESAESIAPTTSESADQVVSDAIATVNAQNELEVPSTESTPEEAATSVRTAIEAIHHGEAAPELPSETTAESATAGEILPEAFVEAPEKQIAAGSETVPSAPVEQQAVLETGKSRLQEIAEEMNGTGEAVQEVSPTENEVLPSGNAGSAGQPITATQNAEIPTSVAEAASEASNPNPVKKTAKGKPRAERPAKTIPELSEAEKNKIVSGINQLIKVKKDSVKGSLGAAIGTDGRQYISVGGHAAIVYDTPFQGVGSGNLIASPDKAINRVLDNLKNSDAKLVSVPTPAELRTTYSHLEVGNGKIFGNGMVAYRNNYGRNILYLGMGLPAVNADYLRKMLPLMPGADVYAGSVRDGLYLKAEGTEGLILPIKYQYDQLNAIINKIKSAGGEENGREERTDLQHERGNGTLSLREGERGGEVQSGAEAPGGVRRTGEEILESRGYAERKVSGLHEENRSTKAVKSTWAGNAPADHDTDSLSFGAMVEAEKLEPTAMPGTYTYQPVNKTQSMAEAEKEAARFGKNVKYFAGGTLTTRSGESIRGVTSYGSDSILVQVDNHEASSSQLAKHELVHCNMTDEEITSLFDDEEIASSQAVQAALMIYATAYDEDHAKIELACDSYGLLNQFKVLAETSDDESMKTLAAICGDAISVINPAVSKAMDVKASKSSFRFAKKAESVNDSTSYSVELPYKFGSDAANKWIDGLDPEAKETCSLFADLHFIGQKNRASVMVDVGEKRHPKVIDVTTRNMLAQEWNGYIEESPAFARTARMLAEALPVDIRKNANIKSDGHIIPTPLEKHFKMQRSFMQRIVDALPDKLEEPVTTVNGKEVRFGDHKEYMVGGEEYRKALINERRRLYDEGLLKPKTINGLSKDTWGTMGFLAANTKTIASGDFTTLCPQMFYNGGCWYCYRVAALESGVNNKLVGEKIWYTGEILRLNKPDIDKLNETGGLRIQSFGDWMGKFTPQLIDMLVDAEKVGLQVKVITKEPSMIEAVAKLKSMGYGRNLYFNLSSDYSMEEATQGAIINPARPFVTGTVSQGAGNKKYLVPDTFMDEEDEGESRTFWKRALAVEEAQEYRRKYPWVNTRIVATTTEEFIRGLEDPWVDVVTGYHGKKRLQERVSSETGEVLLDVEPLGDAGMPRFSYDPETMQWKRESDGKNRIQKALADEIEKRGLQYAYTVKTCCQTGRCATCQGKCGKLARDFNVKNASNRDTRSKAYWERKAKASSEYKSNLLSDSDFNKLNKRYSESLTAHTNSDGYAPVFFSKLERELDIMKQDKIAASSVISYLKGRGVKDEEIKWSGVETFLDDKKSVTKQELIDYVSENRLKIEEEKLTAGSEVRVRDNDDYDHSFSYDEFETGVKDYADANDYTYEITDDGDAFNVQYYDSDGDVAEYMTHDKIVGKGDTHWSEYKVSGGSNYREYLFSLPGNDYSNHAMHVHWGKKDVLAHARVQDFTNSDGNKIMFVEEIQSDWHNAGAKNGYASSNERSKAEKLRQQANDIAAEIYKGYPDYNYGQLKRFDSTGTLDEKIGTAKAEKFRQQCRDIDALRAKADDLDKRYKDTAPDAPYKNTYTDFVLKSLLRKAAEGGYDYLAWTPAEMQSKRWSDEYAEGYRIEYDQQIPKFLRKYGKQWGANLQDISLDNSKHYSISADDEKSIADYMVARGYIDEARDVIDVSKGVDGNGNNAIWVEYDTPDGTKTLRIDPDASFYSEADTVPAIGITEKMVDSVLYQGQPEYSKELAPSDEDYKFIMDQLNNGEYITTYKAMQEVDGKLYSPMAAIVNGKYENEYKLKSLYKSVEHPEGLFKKVGKKYIPFDQADYDNGAKGYFMLDKGKGVNGKALGKVPARFNPYEHSSNLMINDQFSTASKRPNLVVVEMHVPKSELTSKYTAKNAKNHTGMTPWKAGKVMSKVSKYIKEHGEDGNHQSRRVMLSRYAMPWRIVPVEEVAQSYKKLLSGTGVSVPQNVVTPSLYQALVDAGVDVTPASAKKTAKKSANASQSLTDIVSRDELVNSVGSMGYPHPNEWVADRTGKKKEPMKLSDIMKMMEQQLGVNVTVGHIRGNGVRGNYNTKHHGIRTRVALDLPTISHELGHWFDFHYGKISGAANINKGSEVPADVKQDLENALGELARAYPKSLHLTEGTAEFFRKYLKNSADASTMYPHAAKYFLGALSPRDLAIVKNLADEVNAYYAYGAENAQGAIRLMEEGGKDFRTPLQVLQDKYDVFYQKMVDSNHAIYNLDKATGGKAYIKATNAAYASAVAGNLITGHLTDIRGQYVGPGLGESLDGVNLKNKKEYKAFNEYLVCLHGPEWLKEGKRVFADDRMNTKGFMDRRIAELDNQYPKFKDSAKNFIQFIKDFNQTWGVSTGIIDPKILKDLNKKYPNYVPFFRALDKDGRHRGAKSGFANQNTPIKRAKGSGLDIIAPVDNFIEQMTTMVNASMRNDVMKAVAAAADQLGADATFLEKVAAPMRAKKFRTEDIKENLTEEIDETLQQNGVDEDVISEVEASIADIADVVTQFEKGTASGNIVTVMRGGKKSFYKVNDPALLESLTNMAPSGRDTFLNAFAGVTRFMTSNITGNNVVWGIFSNAPRDLETFAVYSKSKNPVKALSGYAEAYLNAAKDHLGKSVSPLYAEYLGMGGGHSSVYTSDRNLAKDARKALTESWAKRYLNPLNWASFLTDTIEMGPRFATYKICRESGLSPEESLYEAMDVTVNFRRGGTTSKQVNKFVPFFNAGVQGFDKFGRYFSAADMAGKKDRGKTAALRFALLIATSALAGALQVFMNSKDEDDKKNYDQLSTYTKNSYFPIPIGDGKYFVIPKPRELGTLSSMFSNALAEKMHEDKHAFDDFYSYAADNFFPDVASQIAEYPINAKEKGVSEATGDMVAGVLGAPFFGPAADIMMNRDFLGRPIVSKSWDYKKTEPAAIYNANTSQAAYWIGQGLNVSPLQVDYLGKNVLGYIWKYPAALMPLKEGENPVEYAKNYAEYVKQNKKLYPEADPSLGVKNSYVKDNLYSQDLSNWIYDKAEDSARKANTYGKVDDAITAKLDDNAKSFYSNVNILSKGENNHDLQREVMQKSLDELKNYREKTEEGEKSKAEQIAVDLVGKIGDASAASDILPAVMQTEVKDTGGNDKKAYDLSASQYYEYQQLYESYYDEGMNSLNTKASIEEQTAEVDRIKTMAKNHATNDILQKYFPQANIDTSANWKADWNNVKATAKENDDDGVLDASQVYDLAVDYAKKNGMQPQEIYYDALTKDQKEKYDSWTSSGGSFDNYDELLAVKDLKADKTKDGKSVSGSKKYKTAMAIINEQKSGNFSSKLADLAWDMCGDYKDSLSDYVKSKDFAKLYKLYGGN